MFKLFSQRVNISADGMERSLSSFDKYDCSIPICAARSAWLKPCCARCCFKNSPSVIMASLVVKRSVPKIRAIYALHDLFLMSHSGIKRRISGNMEEYEATTKNMGIRHYIFANGVHQPNC